MSKSNTLITETFYDKLLSAKIDPIRATGIQVKIISFQNESVKLAFTIVDKKLNDLVQICEDTYLREGETINLFDIDKIFNINIGNT